MTGDLDATAHLGDALSALADGQLAADEAAAARAHLGACASCAAELRAVEEVRTLVRGLGPVEPLRPLVAAVPPVGRTSRLAGVAAVAAAAALLALSGVEPDGGRAPQVASLVQVHATSPVNADPLSQMAPAAIPVSLER